MTWLYRLIYTDDMDRVFAAVDIGGTFGQSVSLPSFGALVSAIVKNAFVAAGIISFILLLLGAFGVILGAGEGDSKQMEQAKHTITAAITGLFLVIGSLFIVKVISVITGYDILSPKF